MLNHPPVLSKLIWHFSICGVVLQFLPKWTEGRTYDGPNESPATVRLAKIGARNHAVTLFNDRGTFGISVLANTSRNEDVAILGGGLMREYLGVKPAVKC